jgi:alpha-tubulin suppressor-like RCC1 family protein
MSLFAMGINILHQLSDDAGPVIRKPRRIFSWISEEEYGKIRGCETYWDITIAWTSDCIFLQGCLSAILTESTLSSATFIKPQGMSTVKKVRYCRASYTIFILDDEGQLYCLNPLPCCNREFTIVESVKFQRSKRQRLSAFRLDSPLFDLQLLHKRVQDFQMTPDSIVIIHADTLHLYQLLCGAKSLEWQLILNHRIKAMDAGAFHFIILTVAGLVFTFGDRGGLHGQLGHGIMESDTGTTSKPRCIEMFEGLIVTSVSAGDLFCAVVVDDEDVYTL